jgi:tetratricopeptide (TPR) repeat protein
VSPVAPAGSSSLRRAYLAACLLLLPCLAGADVLHLKDGRSLKVESWEVKGDNVIFEIAGGSVTIPRSLLERVEKTVEEAPAAAAAPAAPTSPVPKTPGARRATPPATSPPTPPRARRPAPPKPEPPADEDWEDMSEAELAKQAERLKRLAGSTTPDREEAARQAALVLSLLGREAVERNDLSTAQGRFGEALTYDARCLPALIGLSAAYLRAGKDQYAKAQIEEGLVAFPKDPALHFLLGEVHYQQENLRDAISEWELSLSLENDPRVAARLEKARREFAVDGEYARKESPHFTFRYDGSGSVSESLAAALRDALEDAYADLSDRYQFIPPAPVVVIFYPTRRFQEVTQEPANVAGLFDGKIRVPLGGVKSLSPPLRAVLVHELTHAFVSGKSGGNCPRWLQEGLAQISEGKALSAGEERSLARDLAATQGRSWYDNFSYPSALSFTRYLEDRYPFEILLEALDAMKSGSSDEEALAAATRESFAALQQGWMDRLVQQFAESR